MENKMSKAVIIGSIICSLVLLGVLSTFAYFILSPTVTRNDLSVETGTLSLTFSDGNPGFNKQLEFGSNAEKFFSITNDGTLEGVAKINWKNIINTYLDGSLTYNLSYSETENGNYLDIITNENVPRSETAETLELANGLVIPPNSTYYYKLTITLNYLDSKDQTDDLKASLITEFSIEEGSRNLVKTLLTKANNASITDYNAGNKAEMFTFLHSEADQTTGWSDIERTDYRYIGNVPNNYIEFNDEIWRIIGVFTVEGTNNVKEQRVKIIKDESIGRIVFNSPSKNAWMGSQISQVLNTGDYYNRRGNYTTNGLTATAKQQIISTKWYLGAAIASSNIGGNEYYNFERGKDTCATLGNCSGESRAISTVANVGLIYPSDYIFAFANNVNEFCFNNIWYCNDASKNNIWYSSIKEFGSWTMTPNRDNGTLIFLVPNILPTVASNNGSTFPVVYLRPDIEITDGNGSASKPYVLKVPTD